MTSYVNIGEETGCLDEVLKSLSEHYEQEIEISENIRSAVTYPLLMLAMMGTVIVILLVKVLPVFQQVFRQMGLEMNNFSNGLLNAGVVISRYFSVLSLLSLPESLRFSLQKKDVPACVSFPLNCLISEKSPSPLTMRV